MSKVESGIFVSYRRQESSHIAGRLYDRLADHFGTGQVFIDVDTIEPGVDFAEAITRAVETCDVLLAVIGPNWLAITDEQGRRRLEDPDDIVRLEIEAALTRNVRVIPILVEDAVMPKRQDLPQSLASLARRNAFIVRYESFRYDAERLIISIQDAIEVRNQERVERAAQQEKAERPSPRLGDSDTQQGTWRLELIAIKGRETKFRLSSGRETHVIAIRLSWATGSEEIEIDGRTVASSSDVVAKKHEASDLSSELGFPVTIDVNRKVPRLTQVDWLKVTIGDQVIKYKA